MRLTLLTIISIFLFSCGSKYTAEDYDLIIQNVKLFNGESVFENATLLIKHDSIVEIIRNRTEFNGNQVVAGEGKTLIPGLINAHVHAFKKADLNEAARSGVLTVLDLFNFSVTADSLKGASIKSNDLAYYYWAGPTVTVPGGHGSQYGPVPLINDIEEIPEFIDDRISEGADFIKLILEAGWPSRRTIPTLSDDMLQTALTYISKKDMISVVHISVQSDAIKVAKYGGNGLAHIWKKDSIGISDDDITTLVENDVFIIPTMLVRKRSEESFRKRGLDDLHIDMEQLKIDLLNLHKRGVPLLAGTDPPNMGINFGTDLFNELYIYVDAGLSPIEALKTATSVPSIEFRLGERGYIRKGYAADFVLIDGDPTKDIKNIANVFKIWKRGQEITPYNKR